MHSPFLTRRSYLSQALGLGLSSALPALAQEKSPAHKGQVTINITLEPDSLDPTMAASASVGEVTHYNLLEGLTKIQEDGRVSPLLAQSWQVSADQRNYRFALRQGVRFHDGAALDAQVVRYSMERARGPGSTNKLRKALFDNIAHIDAPDPHSLALTLHNPDPHLLFRLGESAAVIVHPSSAAQLASRPVGTGPYRLDQWQRGRNITLLKAETWRGPAPAIPRAEIRFFYGQKAIESAREAEQIDVFFHYASSSLRRLLADHQYQLFMGTSGGKGMLALNHRRPPLGDLRVRRAIAHAIDREAFIRQVLDGRGSAIGSHFSPLDSGYVHLGHLYPYDPARARALLAEAGVGDSLQLQLALPPPAYARLGGPFIVKALKDIGITAEPQTLEWNEWLKGPFQGDFDMTLITHVEPLDYAIYTDPQYYFGYDSAAFRALAHKHAQASHPRERQRFFAQMQRHLADDAVNAWIFSPQLDTAVRKGLRGVWMHYPIFAHDIAAMSWA